MTTIYSKAGADAAISAATDALTPEDVGADPSGTAAAAIAALGLGTAAVADATDFAPAASGAYPVQQVALTGNLAYTLPVGAPADQVISVVFTQDGTGGHTVTYDDQPVSVDLTAGASTTVELHPVGSGYVLRYPTSEVAQLGSGFTFHPGEQFSAGEQAFGSPWYPVSGATITPAGAKLNWPGDVIAIPRLAVDDKRRYAVRVVATGPIQLRLAFSNGVTISPPIDTTATDGVSLTGVVPAGSKDVTISLRWAGGTATATSVSLVLGTMWGFNMPLPYITSEQRQSRLARAAGIGCTVARYAMPQAAIETAPGVYDWAVPDAVIADVAAAGMRSVVIVWGNSAAAPPTTSAQLAGWGAFCSAIAARYAGQVWAWEIWNEPDLAEHWAAPSVTAYSRAFLRAARHIRQHDTAPIVTGGITSAYAGSMGAWVSEFRRLGVLQFADGIGIHTYEAAFSGYQGNTSGGLGQARDVRRALDLGGFGHLPSVTTEFGMPSLNPIGGQNQGELDQVAHIQIADGVQRANGWSPAMICHTDQDSPDLVGVNENEKWFGLWRSDGTAKPGVAALQAVIEGI